MKRNNCNYADMLYQYSNLPYYNNVDTQRYLCYRTRREKLCWEDVITRVNLGLDREFYTEIKEIKKPEALTVLVNKYYRLPEEYIPKDLETICPRFNEGDLVLRHTAKMAFEDMCRSAEQQKLYLRAISTFRSYSYQEEVYLRKKIPEMDMEDYRKERDKVSARPGHSEHQTGLAVDINELEQTFENTPQGKWLAANAYKFGFILRYPKGKEEITGYDYEPWHFRYLGSDLAKCVYCSGITYDEFYIRHL